MTNVCIKLNRSNSNLTWDPLRGEYNLLSAFWPAPTSAIFVAVEALYVSMHSATNELMLLPFWQMMTVVEHA